MPRIEPKAPAEKIPVPKLVMPTPKSVAPARADVPPEKGYSVVVDGHFKALHATEAEALANGQALKARFPFLRIEIFDAVKKTRSSVN